LGHRTSISGRRAARRCLPGALAAALALGAPPPTPHTTPYTTWSDYSGAADSMQYSALKQINKTNVDKLQLVWSHLAPGPTGRFSFSPLIVDDVL
jgi:glucose dehydrogenase